MVLLKTERWDTRKSGAELLMCNVLCDRVDVCDYTHPTVIE